MLTPVAIPRFSAVVIGESLSTRPMGLEVLVSRSMLGVSKETTLGTGITRGKAEPVLLGRALVSTLVSLGMGIAKGKDESMLLDPALVLTLVSPPPTHMLEVLRKRTGGLGWGIWSGKVALVLSGPALEVEVMSRGPIVVGIWLP